MAGPKRTGLIQSAKAAKEQAAARHDAGLEPPRHTEAAKPENPLAPPLSPGKRNRDLTDASATTAVHIPKDQLALLRRVAVERANREGGRPSVSNVLRDLIERHRAELEREAAAR